MQRSSAVYCSGAVVKRIHGWGLGYVRRVFVVATGRGFATRPSEFFSCTSFASRWSSTAFSSDDFSLPEFTVAWRKTQRHFQSIKFFQQQQIILATSKYRKLPNISFHSVAPGCLTGGPRPILIRPATTLQRTLFTDLCYPHMPIGMLEIYRLLFICFFFIFSFFCPQDFL